MSVSRNQLSFGVVKKRLLAGLVPGVVLMTASAASAVTIANDGFETNTHPTGFRTVATSSPVPGNNGITFYTAKDPGLATIGIINDPAFGGASNRALTVTGTPAATSYPLIGKLPLIATLDNINDNVTLSFKFRLLNAPTSSPSGASFRFGLFNSNGTVVTGDNQTANSDNDQGYYAQIGDDAQVAGNLLYRESGTISPILAGNDRSTATASGGVAAISDSNVHTAVLSLTRTTLTSHALSVSIDSATPVTLSVGAPYTQFDQIAFSNGFVTPSMNFALDDVVVEATSFGVPEPTALSVLAVGVAGLLSRRRRAASR